MSGARESLGVFSKANGGERLREVDFGSCVGARKGEDAAEPCALPVASMLAVMVAVVSLLRL